MILSLGGLLDEEVDLEEIVRRDNLDLWNLMSKRSAVHKGYPTYAVGLSVRDVLGRGGTQHKEWRRISRPQSVLYNRAEGLSNADIPFHADDNQSVTIYGLVERFGLQSALVLGRSFWASFSRGGHCYGLPILPLLGKCLGDEAGSMPEFGMLPYLPNLVDSIDSRHEG